MATLITVCVTTMLQKALLLFVGAIYCLGFSNSSQLLDTGSF